MAEELDILQDTTQDGAVFADTTTQEDSEEVVDNARYNDEGERLYYWVPPSELGDVITRDPERALYQDTGGYYTEDEIRAAWDADQGMGYLKEQTDWDNYWGYLTERQDLIDDGTIFDATGADAAGREARQDVIQQGGGLKEMGGAKGAATAGQGIRYEGYSDYYQSFLEQPEQMALMSKYGISPVIENKDGDVFGWNGSSYTKVVKVDDHNYGSVVGGLIKSFVIGAITGGIFNEFVNLMTNVGGFVGKAATNIQDLLNMNLPGGLSAGADGAISAADMAVIVNLTEQGVSDALDVTDNQNDDGMTRHSVFDLPPGYIFDEVRGIVIHEESGTEYDVAVSPWGALVNLPDVIDESSGGGGGAAEDPSADADNDGVPDSQDPDDNNPDVPVQGGGGIVNETGEEVTTGGEKVEGDGTPVGSEYRWKYIGNGCFVQIDENGQEIPDTKVCDPDYTEEDYELYEVGGIFGRGTDVPFGTPDGDEETDVTPAAGTQTEDCLSNGDKIIYTADGEGNWETEVIAGGCLEKEEGEDDGGITLGGSPDWGDGADAGGDAEAGGTDAGDDDTAGDVDSGDADTDADGDGTEGTGETGAGDDGAGDDGTGEGEGGDGEGEGDGGDGEVSLGGGMMGKPASFQGMMAGLSYEPQPIPGIIPTPQIDYAADLEELIARQLSKRGMFT